MNQNPLDVIKNNDDALFNNVLSLVIGVMITCVGAIFHGNLKPLLSP